MLTVTLPWPARELSPNSRASWRVIAKRIEEARALAKYETMNALEDNPFIDQPPFMIFWYFYPPDGRKRDLSNMHDMMKASQDGIFDAIHHDDYWIEVTETRRFRPDPPGRVVVYLRSLTEND